MKRPTDHPPGLVNYSYPEGLTIPRLMPCQDAAFNGDFGICKEVIRLRDEHSLKTAIETGTCLGSTALWLSTVFEQVDTCEINVEYAAIANRRIHYLIKIMRAIGTITIEVCASSEMLARKTAGFYFLDAHWGDHCPLLDELNIIAEQGTKPCILIHDFQVPGTDFGYDSMPDGRPFNMELVKPYLDRIYGEGNWKHNYPKEVAGARRGWISIEPA